MLSLHTNTVSTEDLRVESGKGIQWFKENDTVVNGKKFQSKIIDRIIKTNSFNELNMMTNTLNLTIIWQKYLAQIVAQT